MVNKSKLFNSKSKTLLIALLALILFSFKKKPVPTVEKGEGDSGKLGTGGKFPTKGKSVFKPGSTTKSNSYSPKSTSELQGQMNYNDSVNSKVHLKSVKNACCN